MVAAPHIDVQLGGGGASGHDHFSIADHLGVGIPGGVNVGLGHDEKISAWRTEELYELS